MNRFECSGRWWFVGQQVAQLVLSGLYAPSVIAGEPEGDWLRVRRNNCNIIFLVHASIVEPAP